jgi:hypothetical protein
MKKIIIVSLILLITTVLVGDIQELPDVEITGPSSLDTYTGKKGLVSSELMIPDIVDSLRSILPTIPDENPVMRRQAGNAFYLNVNQRLGFKTYLICDSLFSKSSALFVGAEYETPRDEWKYFNGRLGLQHTTGASRLGISVGTINAYSPYLISRQTVNALNLYYNINNVIIFKRMLYINLTGELQQTHQVKRDEQDATDNLHVYNRVNLGYLHNYRNRFEIGGGLAFKTPYAYMKAGFVTGDEKSYYSFIRGLSVQVTDKRFMPCIHLSRIFQIDTNNSIQLYQKSDVKIHDTFRLLSEQPWQRMLSDVVCEYLPLNAHLIINNKSLDIGDVPISLTADLGLLYYIDKPVYHDLDDGNLFPMTTPQDVITNELSVRALYSGNVIRLSQELKLVRARLVDDADSRLPYQPELALFSSIEYRKKAFTAQAWLNQYFKTRNDIESNLRDSFDLGARVEYSFSQRFAVHLKAENVLNKGLYLFRTIPVMPPTYSAGFIFSF